MIKVRVIKNALIIGGQRYAPSDVVTVSKSTYEQNKQFFEKVEDVKSVKRPATKGGK